MSPSWVMLQRPEPEMRSFLPGDVFFSRTRTFPPPPAAQAAQKRPAGPPPTTMRSHGSHWLQHWNILMTFRTE